MFSANGEHVGRLAPTRTRTGVALTRADAVLDARFAIEKALESRQRNA